MSAVLNRSLKGLLQAIAPFTSPALISDHSLMRLIETAGRLPVGQMGGFEVRLGADTPVVDLFACLKPGGGSQVPAAFLLDPVWRNLASCLASSRGAGSGFQRFVRRIDIEFDLDKPQPAIPVPSFFFNLDECHRGPDGQPVKLTAVDLLGIVRQTSDLEACERVKAQIDACIAQLPEGASVQYLGLMARGGQTLRLAIGGLRLDQVTDYLSAIAWPGDAQALRAALQPVVERSRPLGMLDLDVGTSLSQKVGIECYMNPPASLPAWAALLDTLVGMGLCTAAKREGLLQWISPALPPPVKRAAACTAAMQEDARDEQPLGYLWKSINHIKVVSQGSELLEAKAYLGFGHKRDPWPGSWSD